jgi:TPR repeat protein
VVQRVAEDRAILEQLHAFAPARLRALAVRWTRAASFLARKEAAREPLDWQLVHGYLAVGEPPDPQRGAEVRELLALVAKPLAQDAALLRAELDARAWSRENGVLLLAWAQARAGSDARSLIERAAKLGSDKAREKLFGLDFAAAPDKVAFMTRWIADGRPVTGAAARACMALGAQLEHGNDRDEAVRWYERAVGRAAGDRSFSGFVGLAFDRRMRSCLVEDDELAMRWYERSLELGDDDSMDIWLRACAAGEMGLAPDPANALERAKRFRASGVDLKARRWRIAPGIRAARAAAEAQGDPALAARWGEVAALLERD